VHEEQLAPVLVHDGPAAGAPQHGESIEITCFGWHFQMKERGRAHLPYLRFQ